MPKISEDEVCDEKVFGYDIKKTDLYMDILECGIDRI